MRLPISKDKDSLKGTNIFSVQILVSRTILPYKEAGLLGKMADSRMRPKIYDMSMGPFVMPESKEVLKTSTKNCGVSTNYDNKLSKEQRSQA